MHLRNSNKGVSMSALVITIIVIIILGVLSVMLSTHTIDNANFAAFTNELYNIENKARTMQMQLQKEKRDDYSFSAIGLKKVSLNKTPWNFKSADDSAITGYVVDLNTLDLNYIKRGREKIPNSNIVTFGVEDLFILDSTGKAFYAKGFDTESGKVYYNIQTIKSDGISGPTISDIKFTLSPNKSSATVSCKATSELGNKVFVYIDGIEAKNIGNNTYQTIVSRNKTYYIRACEENGLLSIGNIAVSGIINATASPSPTPTVPPTPSPTPIQYKSVNVSIRKDGESWPNSGIKVSLYKNGSSAYSKTISTGDTTSFSVIPGIYKIYAMQHLSDSTVYDTGMTIDATYTSTEATLNYYTINLNIKSRTVLSLKTVNESSLTNFANYSNSSTSNDSVKSYSHPILRGTTLQAEATPYYSSDGLTALVYMDGIRLNSPSSIIINQPRTFESLGGYLIEYNSNAGSDYVENLPEEQIKSVGVSIKLSDQVPVRNGWVFKGWSTSSTATSASYQPGANYTSNSQITLYAVWYNTVTVNVKLDDSDWDTNNIYITLKNNLYNYNGYTTNGEISFDVMPGVYDVYASKDGSTYSTVLTNQTVDATHPGDSATIDYYSISIRAHGYSRIKVGYEEDFSTNLLSYYSSYDTPSSIKTTYSLL